MVALELGALAAILTYVHTMADGQSDFDQLWGGAHALLAGRNPYTSVGPGRWFDTMFWLAYPLPAILIVLPFAWLPLGTARVVFFGVVSACLAYALTKESWHRLFVFLSLAFLYTAFSVQWSPVLTAATVVPWLGFTYAAKPNIGAALWAGYPSWRALGLAALAVAVSFAVMPSWVADWRANLTRLDPYPPMVLRPGGIFLLLTLLKWRRPEARLLGVLSLVPQTGFPYETIPLFLIPNTWRESLVLSLSTSAGFLAWVWYHPSTHQYSDALRTVGILTLVFAYLPALVMVLRRPNEGEVPAVYAVPIRAIQRRWTA